MRKNVVLILFLGLASCLFAEDGLVNDKPENGAPDKITSQAVREKKAGLLFVSPSGLDVISFMTTPVTLGIFLMPQVLAEVRFGQVCLVCTSPVFNSAQLIGGGLRWFTGDTLNFITEVNQFNILGGLEFGLTTFRLGIGNMWFFENGLILALDWASVNIPFRGNFPDISRLGEALPLIVFSSVSLLTFSLGYAF